MGGGVRVQKLVNYFLKICGADRILRQNATHPYPNRWFLNGLPDFYSTTSPFSYKYIWILPGRNTVMYGKNVIAGGSDPSGYKLIFVVYNRITGGAHYGWRASGFQYI